ncbi:hypothetical protein HNY73_008278 [Argiope bruennichi]|uniref:Uncharacterized protein n=1 Tax=Argiope bruennichi TaxID=94029 RepID=A0A8T0F873_ARGBR|nr:hypothetical protein HNY73_008278 [Argiope bruennichi]
MKLPPIEAFSMKPDMKEARKIKFCQAYMMKSYQLQKLPRPLQVSDLVRAAVLGKLRLEENVFSKLLVTFNNNFISEKYKKEKKYKIFLGLVTKQEIPFYPEVKEAEKQLIEGVDRNSVLPLLDQALEIYPKNDTAYAVRGQLFEMDGNTEKVNKILDELTKFKEIYDVADFLTGNEKKS